MVGVSDDGYIIGIEKGFAKLNGKNNWDGWLKEFSDAIRSNLGTNCLQLINCESVDHKNGTVAKIFVHESPNPIFVKKYDEELFFVRGTNSTIPLSMSEFYEYCRDHFR
jgi:hypothetical protein